MAVTDAYATLQEYKEIAEHTDDDRDSVITDALLAISNHITVITGRFFTKDVSDATRVYQVGQFQKDSRSQYRRLFVDDLSASPTSIKIDEDADGDFSDETALASTDFELGPYNANLGQLSEPFRWIEMTPWGDYGKWTAGQRVQVIAKFGWPSVPVDIKMATVEVARILLAESYLATDRISESLDETVSASNVAKFLPNRLIEKYKRARY